MGVGGRVRGARGGGQNLLLLYTRGNDGEKVDVPFGGFDLPVSGLVGRGMMLSVKAASLWKRLRFLTISLEKSRDP